MSSNPGRSGEIDKEGVILEVCFQREGKYEGGSRILCLICLGDFRE